MRRLAPVGEIKGVESLAAAAEAANDIGMEVRLEAVLSAASRYLISVYCIVVVAANWLRAVPLFLAAEARLSKWPSDWAI